MTDDAILQDLVTLLDHDWYIAQHPELSQDSAAAVAHFLERGRFLGHSPNPLFDPDFYLRTNPDVKDGGLDALSHYMEWGGREHRDPSAAFSSAIYVAAYPDSIDNPLLHYYAIGRKNGAAYTRSRHQATSSRATALALRQSQEAIAQTGFDPEYYISTYGDLSRSNSDSSAPYRHYLEHGAAEGRKPNLVFDSRWYLLRYPDVQWKGHNPLVHYMNWGALEGRDPSAHFDSKFYVDHHPDAAVNPLLHYLHKGLHEGYPTSSHDGHKHQQPSLIDLPSEIRAAFDAEYYKLENPDVLVANVDPLWHFHKFGQREGRNPNSLFDSAWYTARYSDRFLPNESALQHYFRAGARNGCEPGPLFDTAFYSRQHPEAAENPLAYHIQVGRAKGYSTHPFLTAESTNGDAIHDVIDAVLTSVFDEEYYRLKNPDIDRADVNALDHYRRFGGFEGRNPNDVFDSAWYIAENADVRESGINPLLHYMQHGAAEHRDPSPMFDAVFYADEHPDSSPNPLLHYISAGRRLGYPTERTFPEDGYRPVPLDARPRIDDPPKPVDVIIPVYRGLGETKACLDSLFTDPLRCFERIIVVDDRSPEPALSEWLQAIAERHTGTVELLVNEINLGFVGSVNRALRASLNDVVLLNSDTEVPQGWLQRLAAHAAADGGRVATVTPLSNNATICSYPSHRGGKLPFGLDLETVDRAAWVANAGRATSVPTGVGFCMYVSRACLTEIGLLDEEAFGKGYGEEVDLCFRAERAGWRNLLACDLYVYHAGEVSFGKGSTHLAAGQNVLRRRYPEFDRIIGSHVRRNEIQSYRVALTAELGREFTSRVLHVTHDLGGGVQQHIAEVAAFTKDQAFHFLLQPSSRGVKLSIHDAALEPLVDAAIESDELRKVFQTLGITRVHVHHVLGFSEKLKHTLASLGVPFDLTVHDFYLVCPQINFLPQPGSEFCGQPREASCNTCISKRGRNGCADIDSWRSRHRWLFQQASRVICPSRDTADRIAFYGESYSGSTVVSHDFSAPSRLRARDRIVEARPKCRVCVIGVLAEHKGLTLVESVINAMDASRFDVVIIGSVERELVLSSSVDVIITGHYQQDDLAAILEEWAPDVAMFPAKWPETYSYTLTAALSAGLPIAAMRMGAFVERLAFNPQSCLLERHASPSEWVSAVWTLHCRKQGSASARKIVFEPDAQSAPFYSVLYDPVSLETGTSIVKSRKPIKVLIYPERYKDGRFTPCGFIRVLLPFLRLDRRGEIEVVVGDSVADLECKPDIIVLQRYPPLPEEQVADIVGRASRSSIPIIFEIDDDLLGADSDHPEQAAIVQHAPLVQNMLKAAAEVWVSTSPLAERVRSFSRAVHCLPNALDEQLWELDRPRPVTAFADEVRVLYMGTATHESDFKLVSRAIERVHQRCKRHIRFEIIGVTEKSELPAGVERVDVPNWAKGSYPMFVKWITSAGPWDIGIAPLINSSFNKCKSGIKALDYGALQMFTIASDTVAYRGSLADGVCGSLVRQSAALWEDAIIHFASNRSAVREAAARGRAMLRDKHTLQARSDERLRLLKAML